MKTILMLTLTIVIRSAMALPIAAELRPECEAKLSPDRWTEAGLNRAIRNQPGVLSQPELSQFVNRGVPQLIRLANENGISVWDVLENVRAAVELIAENLEQMDGQNDAQTIRRD